MPTRKPTTDNSEKAASIRMPTPLHQRIAKLAKRQRRSFNAQSVIVLERGIAAAEAEDAK